MNKNSYGTAARLTYTISSFSFLWLFVTAIRNTGIIWVNGTYLL